MASNISNPIIYLKKGFLFPKTSTSIEASFRGNAIRITNSKIEKIPVFAPHGDTGGGMTTDLRCLWITYYKNTNDAYVIFADTLEIINILSLLLGKYYFDTNTFDIYTCNPGSLMHNVKLEYPTVYRGLCLEGELNIDNSEFAELLKKAQNLSEEDFSYFKSATYLIKDAKKKFYRGEDSAAITDAVSAIEALYLRPDASGIFKNADLRFIPENVIHLEPRFKHIFYTNGEQAVFDTFHPSLYTVRSGHLHSGRIYFYEGVIPRSDDDKILEMILACQRVIIKSLDSFFV